MMSSRFMAKTASKATAMAFAVLKHLKDRAPEKAFRLTFCVRGSIRCAQV